MPAKLNLNKLNISQDDLKILKPLAKLNSPIKIQKFLDTLPVNLQRKGGTYMSPARAIRADKAMCIEGAMIACLAFWLNGKEPLLLDFKTINDDDHVVALYKINNLWGAISKTNHSTLRFRDPVYRSVRELAMSYFHEYFNQKDGVKILRSYSAPLNLKKFGTDWITDMEDLDYIAEDLDDHKHYEFYPKKNKRYIRRADKTEIRAGEILEWAKNDPRT